MVGALSIPKWLEIVLEASFFTKCIVHQSIKKNEKNIFCLDCCGAICAHCLPSHRLHSLLQIRRYVYHDVIRLSDAQKLLDCSLVQSYTINGAKVVFLKERPLTRPFRASGNFCIKCDRSLQHPFLFCSLSCKVGHLRKGSRDSYKERKLVYECEFLQLPRRELTESFSELTPDSSGSTTSCSEKIVSTTTMFMFKNNNSSCSDEVSLLPQPAAATNRRKSVPQRSPMH